MRAPLRLLLCASAVFPVLAALTLAPRDARAFEYVQNGGFEEDEDGWAAVGATVEAVSAAAVPPANGSASGRVTVSSPTFIVRPTTATDIPPSTYTFGARARAASRSLEIRLVLRLSNGESAHAQASVPAGEWTTISGEVTLPEASDVSLQIMGTDAAAGDVFYIDGVSIDGAPPATRTSTATSSPTSSATGTRTGTPTRTPTATKTPTVTPVVDVIAPSLRNGGFEDVGNDSAPLEWHKFGGAFTGTTDTPHGGLRAARFESESDSTKWIYQAVTVEPGAWYAFNAWLLVADAGVDSAFLRLSWYASPDGSGEAIASIDSPERLSAASAGYRALSTGGAQAPSDARSARLRVMLAPRSSAHAEILVDDAAFGPSAPAPAEEATTAPDAPGTTHTPARAVLGLSKTPSNRISTSGRLVEASQSGRVLINEVLYDALGAHTDADGEWVELYNAGDHAVDLAGWTLSDDTTIDSFRDQEIEPGAYYVFHASDSLPSDSASTSSTPHARLGNGLGNDGDRLLLRDASGAVIDAVSWGTDTYAFDPSVPDVPAGHSIERRQPGLDTDSAADWADNESPSPGGPLNGFNDPAQAANAAVRESTLIGTGRPGDSQAWIIWPLVIFTGAAAVGTVAYRLAPSVRQRLRLRR